MQRLRGILWAATSSSTFGLTPLFSLLLLGAGYSSCEVLTYRWGVAALALALLGVMTQRNYRLTRLQIRAVALLSLMRALTSFSLIVAYQSIASGVAATIHFLYPLAVAFAMICLFGEQGSRRIYVALALSVAGAALLSAGNVDFAQGNALLGIAASVVSVFSYGGYIVGVRRTCASQIDSTVLTTYVMGVGAVLFLLGGCFTGGVRLESDPLLWLWILALALPSTALSNIALVRAINCIGPTLTSIFGAMEPLTAVVVGVAIFGEPFTPQGGVGIAMILSAVAIVILRSARSESR